VREASDKVSKAQKSAYPLFRVNGCINRQHSSLGRPVRFYAYCVFLLGVVRLAQSEPDASVPRTGKVSWRRLTSTTDAVSAMQAAITGGLPRFFTGASVSAHNQAHKARWNDPIR